MLRLHCCPAPLEGCRCAAQDGRTALTPTPLSAAARAHYLVYSTVTLHVALLLWKNANLEGQRWSHPILAYILHSRCFSAPLVGCHCPAQDGQLRPHIHCRIFSAAFRAGYNSQA